MAKPRLAAELLLESPPVTSEVRWSKRDTAIYNLGIGFGMAASEDEAQLPFVLEERVRAFPTMISVLEAKAESLFQPRYNIDLTGAVHGEEAIELHRPLAGEGALCSRRHVDGVWDKGEGRGAVLRVIRALSDAVTGEPVATVRSTIMLRFNGGYGGSNEGAPRPRASPERAADGAIDMPTRPEQAMLYRLSGDRNPLHVDPDFARGAGYPRPILMGLCSLGFAGRALVSTLGGGDPDRLTAIGLRFTGAVFPGETLRIEHWQLEDGEVAFRGIVAERGTVALDGGRARIAA